MPYQVAGDRPNFQAFNDACQAAVNCDHCFAKGYARRAYIDNAQPRYVGPNYWTSTSRLLFLSINPGAGNASVSDQLMRNDIEEYKSNKLTLYNLFARQRGYMAEWGRYGQFLRYYSAICNLEDVALLNVAWCATTGNEYPDRMLDACFSRHTRTAIETLCPTNLIACGGKAQQFARKYALPFAAIPHYAARGNIDYAAIRRTLENVR